MYNILLLDDEFKIINHKDVLVAEISINRLKA